ncbi:hypothetical protein D3C71_1775840 [compost metagenome]
MWSDRAEHGVCNGFLLASKFTFYTFLHILRIDIAFRNQGFQQVPAGHPKYIRNHRSQFHIRTFEIFLDAILFRRELAQAFLAKPAQIAEFPQILGRNETPLD